MWGHTQPNATLPCTNSSRNEASIHICTTCCKVNSSVSGFKPTSPDPTLTPWQVKHLNQKSLIDTLKTFVATIKPSSISHLLMSQAMREIDKPGASCWWHTVEEDRPGALLLTTGWVHNLVASRCQQLARGQHEWVHYMVASRWQQLARVQHDITLVMTSKERSRRFMSRSAMLFFTYSLAPSTSR